MLYFQYVIIAMILLMAVYCLVRVFTQNFSSKKKGNGCDKGCGCS